jgi:hypothetical protein
MTASVDHPMPWHPPDACALDYGRVPSDSNLKDHLEARNQPCTPRMADMYAQQTYLREELDELSYVFGSVQLWTYCPWCFVFKTTMQIPSQV